ncbi:MAG: YtxH domain-containing protein [Acidobacteriota bacterium]|nr:YtxH domain-containing protein [Blastocatellia bacterium]MDW8412864.1 YtxH domain-containing protein [Acidobacteriota bacterium]
MSERNDISSKLAYFLIGAGVGAIVALLFAPKSGQELREDIAGATRRSLDYANQNVKALGQKASALYEAGREKTSGLIDHSKEVLQEQKERVSAAIEAGKRAYQEKKAASAAAIEGEQS